MVRRKKQPVKPPAANLDAEIARIGGLGIDALRAEWRKHRGTGAPAGLTKDLLARALTYQVQEQVFGGLSAATRRVLRDLGKPRAERARQVKVGSVIVREHDGIVHEVLVVPGGFCWQGQSFDSLSTIAKRITGTNWNGPRFFGLRGRAGDGSTPAGPVGKERLPKAPRGRRSTIGERLSAIGQNGSRFAPRGAAP